MRKVINVLNLKQKIFAIILIPTFALMLVGAFNIYDKNTEINELKSFQTYFNYYEKIASLIDKIDNERLVTFSYIGSDGVEFKDELFLKRKEVDKKFIEIKHFIQKNNHVFDIKLSNNLVNNYDYLEIFRYDVDRQNLFLDIENNYFTDMVYNMLYTASNIPTMTNNKFLSNHTLAYKHFIEAKEFLSLKAGLLNYSLSSQKFTTNNIRMLRLFDESFKNHITMFKYFVNDDIKTAYSDSKLYQYGSIIKFYNKVRKQAFSYDSQIKKVRDLENIYIDTSKLDLEKIQKELMDKIALVNNLEEKLLIDIRNKIHMEIEKFYEELHMYMLSVIFIILIVIVIGIVMYKDIISKISKLENGLLNFFNYIKRKEDKFYPIKLDGNDEINHMAEIVNDSISETALFVQEEVKKEKLLFTQMAEAEKMAQMGEMIGNIAHQWRQPLSLISTISTSIALNESLGQKLDSKALINNMDKINDYTQYLSETIEVFRDYLSDKKELKVQSIQSNIKSAMGIVAAVLKDVSIELIDNVDYDRKDMVYIVSGELPQVLINLINNAKDAILDNKIEDGWIKIDLKREFGKLVVSVEDNGGGIPQEISKKIFDPYFTTKHKAQGTGLGLHMSYKIIVESMKGKIYTKNTENGAKFFIEVPYNS